MADVVRVKGSPDKWYAQGPNGWVNEKGDVVQLRAQPDGTRESWSGEEGDRKVELLGGFGGKVTLSKVAPKVQQVKKPTFGDDKAV